MRTQGIERAVLEKNLVFGLAEQSPIFVIDNRIYYCSENASPDTFKINRRAMSVNEGPSLNILEELSEQKLRQDYEEYQRRLIAEELQRKDTLNNENYNENHTNLIKFTIERIFPNLRKNNPDELDKLFKIKQKQQEQKEENNDEEYIKEVKEYVLTRVDELQTNQTNIRQPPRQNKLESLLLNQNLSKSNAQESIFLEIMGGYNFAIIDNRVYNLANVSKGEQLNIKGVKYALVENCSFRNLKNDFVMKKIRDFTIKTLKEHLIKSEEFQRIRQERQDIDKICMMDNYTEQDFGFIKDRESTLTIYVQVPDYVLKQPGGDNLYEFSGHRLGIKIGYGHNSYDNSSLPVLIKDPYALDLVSGPFYNGQGGGLCMGGYNYSFINNMERGKALAKLLVDARNVVLRGYQRGRNPYHVLENYTNRRITPEQVKKRGLEITNINYQSPQSSGYENEYDN